MSGFCASSPTIFFSFSLSPPRLLLLQRWLFSPRWRWPFISIPLSFPCPFDPALASHASSSLSSLGPLAIVLFVLSPPLLPRASSPLPYPPSFLSPFLLPLPTPLCPFFVQATVCNSLVLNKVCWHLRGQNVVRVGRTGSCPLRWVRIIIPLCLQTPASRTQERDLNGH